MENKKMKKILLSLVTGGIIITPIVSTIACGSSGNNDKDVSPTIPDVTDEIKDDNKSSFDIPHFSSETNADVIGSFSTDWRDEQPDYWGYGRSKDTSATDSFAPAEYKRRMTTGQPMSPTLDIEDLWNWSPEGTPLGEFASGDIKDPKNIPAGYDPAVSNPKWSGDSNYNIASGAGIASAKNPNIDYNWGAIDGEYNQATVREIAPRTFGEKIKETQSTMSKFSQMNLYSTKNGNNALGYSAGASASTESYVQSAWTYTHDFVTWGGGKSLTLKMPSGAQIDAAHRNGVPIMGTVFMYGSWGTGESEHDQGVMASPGPEGDFPVAKGMVEIADYYGFDGWMVDWESSPANHMPMMDAWEKYAHADYNYDVYPDDNITIADTRTQVQKDNDYYHKPQYVTNYWTYPIVNPRSDISYYIQRHGEDANLNEITGHMNKATGDFDITQGEFINGYGKDTYFPNGAVNYPENGFEKGKKIMGLYYNAAKTYEASQSRTTLENQFSIWNYSKPELDMASEEGFYSSNNGDPRIIDEDEKWTVSNSFQERTTILGHNDFATTFDYGSGANMNLFGGEGIVDSMTTSNGNGWKDPSMQSYLPHYKWIVDEWDASGNAIVSDANPHNGSSVTRKITPILDNTTNEAWLGGTVMTYSGTLADKEKMANKLFASAVPVEAGDKITIKIKDNGEDTIIPDFAAWTIANTDLDEDYDRYAVLKDGDLSHENNQPVTIMEGSPLIYNAENSWYNTNKATMKTIKPSVEATAIGDTGYLQVTYILDSIANHEMRAFGISVVADGNVDMSNLSMGEMKYKTNDSVKGSLNIENIETTGTWDNSSQDWANVRINWDVTSDSTADVRNYFVFLADDEFNPYSLAWNGANTAAYITRIKKNVKSQNILIVAFDNNYEKVMTKKINMKVNK